jgi:hypothetical protein
MPAPFAGKRRICCLDMLFSWLFCQENEAVISDFAFLPRNKRQAFLTLLFCQENKTGFSASAFQKGCLVLFSWLFSRLSRVHFLAFLQGCFVWFKFWPFSRLSRIRLPWQPPTQAMVVPRGWWTIDVCILLHTP